MMLNFFSLNVVTLTLPYVNMAYFVQFKDKDLEHIYCVVCIISTYCSRCKYLSQMFTSLNANGFSAVCKLPTAQQHKCCKIKLVCRCPYNTPVQYTPLQVGISIYEWSRYAFFPLWEEGEVGLGWGGWGCYEFVMRVPCWPSYSTVFSDAVTGQECSLTLHVLCL